MNTEHLKHIIDNYLSRFEELNGPVHREYDKWQVAFHFKGLMDEALASTAEVLPSKLYEVKKLTQNLIDNYTQPFNGLAEFAKEEPETVRAMFIDLFKASEADVAEKLNAVQRFLDSSHQLRDKYYPDSYLYNDDFHSVTGYLFFYDSDHNYLFKATHCRSFADCIEFYDDWGSGADIRLDVFFRMCDEVLSFIKTDENLMAANSRRYDIDPDGMHSDKEKHILLFDLIYCCSTYGLFQGIHYVTPKSGERQLVQERKQKAQELAAKLAEAEEQLALLNKAKIAICEILEPGIPINHKSFGRGIIEQANEKNVIVQFSDANQKTLGLVACVANGLIRCDNEEIQAVLTKHQSILKRDYQISAAVRRAYKELIPYTDFLN